LKKLRGLGLSGKALDWFESYLKGRTQAIELKNTENSTLESILSDPLPTNRGVPQGSALGPMLFIRFTNDMPSYLDTFCTLVMYAEDTTLLCTGDNPDQLSKLIHCLKHGLSIMPHERPSSANKTNQLAFGRRKEEVPALPDVVWNEEAKFLGVTIDSNISWNQQVLGILNKLNSAICVIKRVHHISDAKTAKIAYHALFESNMSYGPAV